MTLAILFGLVLGLTVGFLPGIGPGSAMLLTLPLFLQMEPVNALLAYLALSISCQYTASVLAIVMGVPGIESALPTAKEFPNLKHYRLEVQALKQNAQSSLMGSGIGSLLFLLIFPLILKLPEVFGTPTKLFILAATYVVLLLVSDRKLLTLLLLMIGSYLTTLGYNPVTYETKDFGFAFLDSGIPWIPLVLGSIIGYVLCTLKDREKSKIAEESTLIKVPFLRSSARGSLVGFFVGFIPGLSYVLSSLVTYELEQHLLKEKSIKEKTLRSINASEASQSSGVMAMLMPLLLFSIPITISEGVILNIITLQSSVTQILKEVSDHEEFLVLSLIFVNLVSFLVVLYAKNWVHYTFRINLNVFKWVIFFAGFASIIVSSEYSLSFELLVYLLSVVVFYLLRSDPLAFIMAIFIFPNLRETFLIFTRLYS